MGFLTHPCKCPICGQKFMAESYQVYRAKKAGRTPVCSKRCEQERRHKASRDAKWQAQILKRLKTESPN